LQTGTRELDVSWGRHQSEGIGQETPQLGQSSHRVDEKGDAAADRNMESLQEAANLTEVVRNGRKQSTGDGTQIVRLDCCHNVIRGLRSEDLVKGLHCSFRTDCGKRLARDSFVIIQNRFIEKVLDSSTRDGRRAISTSECQEIRFKGKKVAEKATSHKWQWLLRARC